MLYKLTYLWIICVCFPAVALSQDIGSDQAISNPMFKGIEDSIRAKIKRDEIPSLSIAVYSKGRILWEQSYGYANKEKKIRATPSTPYALASLSKSITSTAIMILAEKGQISLNDPVEKYLGKDKLRFYQGSPSTLTISHLLNMAGGIPHQWEYYYADGKAIPLTIAEQTRRYGIVTFTPGEVFCYSNFSPGLAEQLIVNVSGKPFDQFMREFVFEPLGMITASVSRSKLNPVIGYNKGKPLAPSEFYPKAGAGYFASVKDVISFGMLHLKHHPEKKTILTDSSINLVHSPLPYTHHNLFYANGWGLLNTGTNMNALISNGAIDGAASSLLLLPTQDIAIACLTNATVGNDFTDQIAYSVAETLAPGFQNELNGFFEKFGPDFSDKPFVANDSMKGEWRGAIITFERKIPVQLMVVNDSTVTLKIDKQLPIRLSNISISEGLIQADGNGSFLMHPNGAKNTLQLLLKPGRAEMHGSISVMSASATRPSYLIPAYISLEKK